MLMLIPLKDSTFMMMQAGTKLDPINKEVPLKTKPSAQENWQSLPFQLQLDAVTNCNPKFQTQFQLANP